jgi:hypothetical protein
MKQILKSGLALAIGISVSLVLAGCAPTPEKPAAQAQPEFKGVVPINDIMVSIVDHNAHMIWNAAGDPKLAPKTDQDWHNLEHAATALAASGNMILIPGPPKDDQEWVKDPEWKKYAQDVTNAGLKAVLAVEHRDIKELSTAGDDLVVTCEACHKKFKPSLPGHVAKPQEQPEHYHKATEK